MDSVLNKEKMNISEIYKKRLQGLMKGIKRCKRKKKDDGYIWLTYHVVLMECHVWITLKIQMMEYFVMVWNELVE